MAWVAMKMAARRATTPKTPRAMAIGLSARSAFAATGAVACTGAITPRGIRLVTSDSTAATSRLPWSVCIPKMTAPEKFSPLCASNSLESAGVRMMNVGTRSISSSTISELRLAKPTSLALKRMSGGTFAVPISGSLF
jgi:hypothetical protein